MNCLPYRFLGVAAVCCIGLTASFARGFSFPTVVASPERLLTLNENLFKTYYRELDEIEARIKGKPDSFRYLSQVSKSIGALNKESFEKLQRESLSPIKAPYQQVTREQGQEIFDTILTHPVAGDDAIKRYDGYRSKVGFCFGRAAYVHVELLRRGIHPLNVAKVFVLGDLQYKGINWEFHVATIFRTLDGKWSVIDPAISERVESLELWMKRAEKLDRLGVHPQVRFYFTDAVKFQPRYGAYSPENLSLPYFKTFFFDLAQWFDTHPEGIKNLKMDSVSSQGHH